MKTHYFDQKQADTDDELLWQYVDDRVVPRTCLLGGPMSQLAHESGTDPCANCPGPRDRCRGRPRTDKGAFLETEAAAVAIYQDGTDAMTLKVVEQATRLAALIDEAFS